MHVPGLCGSSGLYSIIKHAAGRFRASYSKSIMKRILCTLAFIAFTFLAVLAFFTDYQVATCPFIFIAILFAGIATSKEESNETGR